MILKLEHIAPYLPYKLKLFFEKSGRIIEMKSCYNEPNLHILDFIEGNVYDLEVWNFKPILKPISKLTIKNKHDKYIIPFEDRYLNLFSKKKIEKVSDVYIYYGDTTNLRDITLIMESLFEHHFDVFGLIDKGLAIDEDILSQVEPE